MTERVGFERFARKNKAGWLVGQRSSTPKAIWLISTKQPVAQQRIMLSHLVWCYFCSVGVKGKKLELRVSHMGSAESSSLSRALYKAEVQQSCDDMAQKRNIHK